MYAALYQYFIYNKELHIPGIGQFQLSRTSAQADFPAKLIYAPSYDINFSKGNGAASPSLYSWLSHSLGLSEREAVIKFNDFAFDLKQRLARGEQVTWKGVGVLQSGLGGELKFEPAIKGKSFGPPVKAEKVIRENAQHIVRVGEDEKTSVEMLELLNQQPASKNYWWAWAIAVALLCIMFLGWYFSSHGLTTHSAGNNKTMVPAAPAQTHQSYR